MSRIQHRPGRYKASSTHININLCDLYGPTDPCFILGLDCALLHAGQQEIYMAPDAKGPVLAASPVDVRSNTAPSPLVTSSRLTPPLKARALADHTK